MIIESVIGLLVIAIVGYLFWKSGKTNPSNLVDVNKDGKVNVEDAKVALDNTKVALDNAVEKVVEKVVFVADVNKDGKVNVDDIKTVAKKVEDKVTTLVDEVKTKKSAKKVQPVAAPEVKPKRARNNGKLVADNPATLDVNEAWEGGKAPEKTTKPKKPKKPKMTVVK
jgi:hypothetical protein